MTYTSNLKSGDTLTIDDIIRAYEKLPKMPDLPPYLKPDPFDLTRLRFDFTEYIRWKYFQ